MGGRSLSYVPCPRCLLALFRDGSPGSAWSSPFFPRILEHFVCFRMTVGESGIRLFKFCVGLHAMAHGQYGFVIQFQFGSQFSRRLALANAAHQEHDLPGRPLTALKDCARVQVVNRSTMFTTLNVQCAGLCSPKLSGLFYVSFALGTVQSLWMKVLKYPLGAFFFIEQFCDWKFHA